MVSSGYKLVSPSTLYAHKGVFRSAKKGGFLCGPGETTVQKDYCAGSGAVSLLLFQPVHSFKANNR